MKQILTMLWQVALHRIVDAIQIIPDEQIAIYAKMAKEKYPQEKS